MKSPSDELSELTNAVSQFEGRFLADHLDQEPTLGPPTEQEILDIAAYVVLAHGALENFIEGIALSLTERAVEGWTKKKRLTRTTASLLMYQSPPKGDEKAGVFDSIRSALKRAKEDLSTLTNNNHGATANHMRILLLPVGVDVPSANVNWMVSLELIVKIRHEWAHQYRFGAKNVKSAADVKQAMADCLALADQLSRNAQQIFDESAGE